MSEVSVTATALEAVAELHAAVDKLMSLPLTSCPTPDVVDALRELETEKRRLAAVDHALLHEVDARHIWLERGYRSMAGFVRDLLHLGVGAAAARVRAAAELGPRTTISGEPLEPVFGTVAAAEAAGQISARHAHVIAKTIDALPGAVSAQLGEWTEVYLTDFARDHDPDQLARHARDLAAALDQDGQLQDVSDRNRQRGLHLRRRADGSARLEGELTAECAEHLEVHFDALAQPKPATEDMKDPRTAGQRRHDALLDMLTLVERAELLPHVGGTAATIVLHMDTEAYTTGNGSATTNHGYRIPAETAKRWAGAEARIIAVLLSKTREITAYSTVQRIFTEQQRLALIARDKGCSFPGCDVTAAWTQAHHITEYRISGRTCVDDATLLCGYHHRHYEQLGWSCIMADGCPHWVPPHWLDHEQRPRRNRMHDY